MTALYVPPTDEADHKKQNQSIQLIGGVTSTNTTNIATNTAAIATLNAATYVNSVATRTGALTLNTASGITNSANDILLSQGSSSQFGAVKVDNTTITAAAGVISVASPVVSPAPITNSLSGDVSLSNVANYFDGPSVAQGSTGTWFASGTVTLNDTAGAAAIFCKLWDGTTVIASTEQRITAANDQKSASLSGYIVSPAGNIRISCRDSTSTSGKIIFNVTGLSKDSTISAFRIA